MFVVSHLMTMPTLGMLCRLWSAALAVALGLGLAERETWINNVKNGQ